MPVRYALRMPKIPQRLLLDQTRILAIVNERLIEGHGRVGYDANIAPQVLGCRVQHEGMQYVYVSDLARCFDEGLVAGSGWVSGPVGPDTAAFGIAFRDVGRISRHQEGRHAVWVIVLAWRQRENNGDEGAEVQDVVRPA